MAKAALPRMSKTDLLEAYRDMFREFGGAGELDDSQWIADLNRRVGIVKNYRAMNAREYLIEQAASRMPRIRDAHIALEESVSHLKRTDKNHPSVKYYLSTSETALERLIKAVERGV